MSPLSNNTRPAASGDTSAGATNFKANNTMFPTRFDTNGPNLSDVAYAFFQYGPGKCQEQTWWPSLNETVKATLASLPDPTAIITEVEAMKAALADDENQSVALTCITYHMHPFLVSLTSILRCVQMEVELEATTDLDLDCKQRMLLAAGLKKLAVVISLHSNNILLDPTLMDRYCESGEWSEQTLLRINSFARSSIFLALAMTRHFALVLKAMAAIEAMCGCEA